MHRRSVLSLSALTAVPVIATAAEEETHDWHDTSDGLAFKVATDDGKITMQVKFTRPVKDEMTEAKDEKGELRKYQFEGSDQPYAFHPGSTLLSRFDLIWDGKARETPKRFWDNLTGFDLETSTLDLKKVPPKHICDAKELLEHLRKPRVMLPAERGKTLIELVRPEECHSHSTNRWIVNKSGTVLRHRHCPPPEF